jgi:hypothetical protein
MPTTSTVPVKLWPETWIVSLNSPPQLKLAEHVELETFDVHPPPTLMALNWATLRAQEAGDPERGATDEATGRLLSVSAQEEPPPEEPPPQAERWRAMRAAPNRAAETIERLTDSWPSNRRSANAADAHMRFRMDADPCAPASVPLRATSGRL